VTQRVTERDPDYLTVLEFSRLVRVSRATGYRFAADNKLTVRFGGSLRVPVFAALKYLVERGLPDDEAMASIERLISSRGKGKNMVMTRRIQGKLYELAELLGQEPEDPEAVGEVLTELRAMARASAALQRAGRQLHDMAQLPVLDTEG
jgi:hypothetical protein